MAMKYNEEENKAIDEKMEHPEKKVMCPKCGKELIYREVGNSCEVKCQTDGCLKATVRGL